MLNKIVDALNGRSDLAGWTVRHLNNHGAQVYAARGTNRIATACQCGAIQN